MLPVRNVKYIIGRALNEIKMETSYLSASASDYDKAFNSYIDMLIEFERDGIVTGIPIPDKITDMIGYEVSHNDLVMMLSERIADMFGYNLTIRQGSIATDAYNRLISSQPFKKYKCNKVPTGYNFYNNYPDNCANFHDDCPEVITTETGNPIIQG